MGKKHHPKIVSRKQVLEFLERLNEKQENNIDCLQT